MERIAQKTNRVQPKFDKESRISYFEMLKQAHKNLLLVDEHHGSDAMKILMNDSLSGLEFAESNPMPNESVLSSK